ncbi:Acidic leucine-rich nuclear phosphoprotein 32-related protein isoform 1 [Schistosoma japonicum]|uniref:Acidic leucine-rich nuclear phosphoprotein 32-related protein (ANP32/acidic nuclear phosphoprotein-like protein) n=1 Tax=Schistosoma japonicum TaxID=6182 RepID=Q5DGN9_SCHJA|nr:SJCHGC00366 protein [Schistosoma japonicum]ABA40386.2 SJCHGC02024 protein [Schistosoma japonicum]KAH8856360.1 Acidic leucine-rich nuclear phosphoprotein 32-related protein [Schistosoma japonicum]TNN10297.1 Acidic leucine-rich nuclear phosphoprotein 32-related protein isoform 1 [Schistosoma japonicum]CAX70673.1 Acidic leucine-rich nuclear phosphoprotein 32-related protein (ANP32/acidic nuclear phosphoprotein-like protein) [Schistosoma japonicum]
MTFMTLLQRIELERGKREPGEITELNLDNSKSVDIEGLTDEYSALEVLSMMNVGLQNLAGLPCLSSLKNLELSNNLISGGLDALLKCPNIEQLNLSSNKIESMDVLMPLAKLSELKSLDLGNCPVTATENYRKKAFAMIPSLKYLDGLDENNEEEVFGGDFLNGGLDEEADGVDEADEEDDEGSDEDDECDDEIGIEALQQSGELEDDEDDYAPGEDEEAELDDYDDVDDEDEEDVEEDNGANLSAANVSGPRRPGTKRRHEDTQDAKNGGNVEHCGTKHKHTEDPVETHTENGSTVDE